MRKILLATSALALVAAAPAVAQDASSSVECVEAEAGTEEYRPSDESTPVQADAAGECPEGMVPAHEAMGEDDDDADDSEDGDDGNTDDGDSGDDDADDGTTDDGDSSQ